MSGHPEWPLRGGQATGCYSASAFDSSESKKVNALPRRPAPKLTVHPGAGSSRSDPPGAGAGGGGVNAETENLPLRCHDTHTLKYARFAMIPLTIRLRHTAWKLEIGAITMHYDC